MSVFKKMLATSIAIGSFLISAITGLQIFFDIEGHL